MKNRSRLMYLIIGVFVIMLLSACVEDNRSLSESKASTTELSKVEATAVSETTAVLETTADGGTIEKDSEGNKITKDRDGRVVAVEDKLNLRLIHDAYSHLGNLCHSKLPF